MLVAGIKYKEPEVILINESGIGSAELAARTCYDSFQNSENQSVVNFDNLFNLGKLSDNVLLDTMKNNTIKDVKDIESSDLLSNLAWVHFHHSILEHSTLTYYIKGTSRAVLQEHARHRHQSISVRSTRYTMSDIINAFISSKYDKNDKQWFINKILSFNMFITEGEINRIEASSIFDKLEFQCSNIGTVEFYDIALSKEGKSVISLCSNADCAFEELQKSKKKRNVGDNFKHIVSDNWLVDMVVTFNLRSLKNYFSLRDSGAAYFQIQMLAKAMKEATPHKYLNLIVKSQENQNG